MVPRAELLDVLHLMDKVRDAQVPDDIRRNLSMWPLKKAKEAMRGKLMSRAERQEDGQDDGVEHLKEQKMTEHQYPKRIIPGLSAMYSILKLIPLHRGLELDKTMLVKMPAVFELCGLLRELSEKHTVFRGKIKDIDFDRLLSFENDLASFGYPRDPAIFKTWRRNLEEGIDGLMEQRKTGLTDHAEDLALVTKVFDRTPDRTYNRPNGLEGDSIAGAENVHTDFDDAHQDDEGKRNEQQGVLVNQAINMRLGPDAVFINDKVNHFEQNAQSGPEQKAEVEKQTVRREPDSRDKRQDGADLSNRSSEGESRQRTSVDDCRPSVRGAEVRTMIDQAKEKPGGKRDEWDVMVGEKRKRNDQPRNGLESQIDPDRYDRGKRKRYNEDDGRGREFDRWGSHGSQDNGVYERDDREDSRSAGRHSYVGRAYGPDYDYDQRHRRDDR